MLLTQRHGKRKPLDDALLRLRLRDSRYCQSILASPWAVSIPACPDTSVFVFVAKGLCWAQVEDDRLSLEEGDFLLLPHGSAHDLLDDENTPPSAPTTLEWDSVMGRCIINAGGNGAVTHLVTGCLELEVNPLIPALPTRLMLRHDSLPEWLHGISQLLRREAARPGPGSEVVVSHLAGLLAVGAIREGLLTGHPRGPGFLQALSDPSIRRALDLIHQDAATEWTLDTLAQQVGMSRSSFSERFHDIVGISPMRYWTKWRMSVAKQWLRDGHCTVDEVASLLGYGSRAAFSRAFKSITGDSPGRVRKGGQAQLRTLNDHVIGQ